VGDQLTVERIAGLHGVLDDYSDYRLFHPVIAEWHTRLTLVSVSVVFQFL